MGDMRAIVTLSMGAALMLAGCASPPPPAPPPVVAPVPEAPVAAAPAPGGPDLFTQIDRNADGRIDQAEFQGLNQLRFRRLDTDGNGALNAAETQQARGAERAAQMDTNGDGAITEAEFLVAQAAVFGRIDADRDGAISRPEFERIAAALAART
jgi:hypothetical protein